MDHPPDPRTPEAGAAAQAGEEKPFGDLLTESKSSQSLRNGILALGFVFLCWVATWVFTGQPLFGFLGALAILVIIRTLFPGKARRIQSNRARRR